MPYRFRNLPPLFCNPAWGFHGASLARGLGFSIEVRAVETQVVETCQCWWRRTALQVRPTPFRIQHVHASPWSLSGEHSSNLSPLGKKTPRAIADFFPDSFCSGSREAAHKARKTQKMSREILTGERELLTFAISFEKLAPPLLQLGLGVPWGQPRSWPWV